MARQGVMEADWYVDPVGQFDGRYFDGETWTERVSDRGILVLDPDWPVHSFGAGARAVGRNRSGESVGRTVAVLPDSVAAVRLVGSEEHRGDPSDEPGGGLGWLWVALGLMILAGVVAALLFDTGDAASSSTDDEVSVVLDPVQEERVADLEEGGIVDDVDPAELEELEVQPPAEADPVVTYDEADAIQVGDLRILNGTSVLEDLGSWHRAHAAEREIDLPADARCWFGRLGAAAVAAAHCGPVAGSSSTEFRYDVVPLSFLGVEGGVLAQAVVDGVMVDEVISPVIELIGPAGVTAPVPVDRAGRGERSGS